MFESNFPVDKVSCSYAVLWEAFRLIVRRRQRRPSSDALYHDTASRTYRI